MHALAAGLLLFAALAAETVPRAEVNRVALLRIAGDERLHVRLAAELRVQHYDVVEVEGGELDAALRATGAQAAMKVEASPELVRVWILNGPTGKQIFREVAPEERAPLDRAIVALWAVELLRASALALRPPVVAATPAPPPPAPVGVALEVAPAVAVSPGGLGPSWHLMLGARWQVGPVCGLEAVVLAPTFPTKVASTGGSALISMGLLGVGAFAMAGSSQARWSAQAAVGAALLGVRATGDVSDAGASGGTFLGRTDQTVSGGPYVRAGASLRAASWFRLRADALSGVMLPRPVVQFGDAQVASWGRPWIAAVVGAEATF
jgi:hypothetical protein